MSLFDEIKKDLEKSGIQPKKQLGQNFLIDESALDIIIETADINEGENIIEIGPGTGILTQRLIDTGVNVTSIEIDWNLAKFLEDKFSDNENFELIETDALKFDPPKKDYKLIANIPYYITSPLISHFLEAENKPKKMVLLIQKEVAEKICAKEGKLNVLAIHVQVFGKPQIKKIVQKESFHPAPKVDSAILEIEVFDEPLIPESEIKSLFKIVHGGFMHKRKTLHNALSRGLQMNGDEVDKLLEKCGIDPNLRPQHLTIPQWYKMLQNSL